jgi:hypothetical protein
MKKVMKKILLASLFFSFLNVAHAEEKTEAANNRFIERATILGHMGEAWISSNFSKTKSSTAAGATLVVELNAKNDSTSPRIHGIALVDYDVISLGRGKREYSPSQNLYLVSSTIAPGLCFAFENSFEGCAAIGFSQLAISNKDNRLNFGGDTVMFYLPYYFTESFNAALMAKNSTSSNRIAGINASFSVTSLALALGWTFE